MIVAAYRDGGFWTLLWQICSSAWTRKQSGSFPPRGFVGLGSSSSVVSDLAGCKLSSIRLRRRASTRSAPRWRLTLEWETHQRLLQRLKSGRSSAPSGGGWAEGGAVTSRRPTTTILISSPLGRLSDFHKRAGTVATRGRGGIHVGDSSGEPIRAVGVRSEGGASLP